MGSRALTNMRKTLRCAGARVEERVQGGNKESRNQQDRSTDLVAFVFPQKGHYPRTGALILFNKIITDLVFPRGFFQGYLPEISCANVFGL
jgi:hypothetical protein